jgi:hypothetical protein
MKKTVEISPEAVAELDAARGNISRSKYLDALLKKSQGVTLPHTHGTDCRKSRKKPKS